jgi:hypothetical protein
MFADDNRYIEPTWSGTFAYRSKCLQEDVRKVYPEHQGLVIPKIVTLSDPRIPSISLTKYVLSGAEKINTSSRTHMETS